MEEFDINKAKNIVNNIFEQHKFINSKETRDSIVSTETNYLRSLKLNDSINVICDETNNTSEIVQSRTFNIYLQPKNEFARQLLNNAYKNL